jgi:hypothetical protein
MHKNEIAAVYSDIKTLNTWKKPASPAPAALSGVHL